MLHVRPQQQQQQHRKCVGCSHIFFFLCGLSRNSHPSGHRSTEESRISYSTYRHQHPVARSIACNNAASIIVPNQRNKTMCMHQRRRHAICVMRHSITYAECIIIYGGFNGIICTVVSCVVMRLCTFSGCSNKQNIYRWV